jgi:hypothetical protein
MRPTREKNYEMETKSFESNLSAEATINTFGEPSQKIKKKNVNIN